MRDPSLWSRLSTGAMLPDQQIAALAARLDIPVVAARRIAAEVPHLRYLDAIAPYDAAAPLAISTLLDLPVPSPDDTLAANRYRDTRALYELEFGAPPPPDIWTHHPPALVAIQLARRGLDAGGGSRPKPGPSWLGAVLVGIIFVVFLSADALTETIAINPVFHALFGLLALVLISTAIKAKMDVARDPEDDTLAARQRLGHYIWADQQLAARSEGGDSDGMDIDGDGGGDSGGGGD